LLGGPAAVTVAGWCIEPVGINLCAEDGQLAPGKAALLVSLFQHQAQDAVAVTVALGNGRKLNPQRRFAYEGCLYDLSVP
jgi:hypothetical protein